MKLLGNIIWFLLGGIFLGLAWALVGLVWCITIVGIPVGVQCFKFAGLSFSPFGRDVYYHGGGVSLILNVLWLIFGGLEIAVIALAIGLIFAITIIGIPFGKQCFKIAKLALMPFGSSIVPSDQLSRLQYR
jgi:uncharacterized membrane protein YccF (DUF307 family)